MHDGWHTRVSVRFLRCNGAGRMNAILAHAEGQTGSGSPVADSHTSGRPPATPQPPPENPRSDIDEIYQITGWDEA